jgi:N-acetylglucosamine-6-phosphate deacetylase
VSAGHTDATYEVMRAAIAAGVRGFTHLFNAMSPLSARAPGVVGAALDDRATWCGVIVDGVHVDPAALSLALKCKAHDKFMLVTDAMPTVGAKERTFRLQGRRIDVKDGVCVAEDGTLAGAHLDMARAVRNAVTLLSLPVTEALAMASANPAAFLSLPDRGAIKPGAHADLVLLDDDLAVRETWIAGATQAEGAAGRKGRG